MNLIKKNKIAVGIKIKKVNGKWIVENNSDKTRAIIFPKISYIKNDIGCCVEFKIDNLKGEAPSFKLINRKLKTAYNIEVNQKVYFKKPCKLFFCAIKVMPKSSFEIRTLDFDFIETYDNEIKKNFNGDILLITPGYPSENNKYLFGFVHTRVREYNKLNWKVDIASVSADSNYSKYEYEGIKVNKINFFDLRNLLQTKRYKKIIVHFFTEQYAQILDATDISETDVFLFFHGTDILYRDFNKLTATYFTPVSDITYEQEKLFQRYDKMIRKYNDLPNVKMIFGTNWAKEESEKQNKIKYNNYEIIPTYINDNIFKYKKKNSELRKKICIIRKYDNVSTYAIDVNVRTILELSRREFFNDLEFNIYGDGYYHKDLLKPIEHFANVHIHKGFLSHDEIAKVHKEHGIALFGTRYETMGVSAAEAAMSGLVVITNAVAAVPEVFDNSELLCKDEDYIEMADKIERLYYDEKLFEQESKKNHDIMKKKYTAKGTLDKELSMLEKDLDKLTFKFSQKKESKLLTIAVASYNVEKFLKNSIYSLLKSKYAHRLEILIINDGSKDRTAEIGKELEKISKVNNDSIVKIINKENGGHGSAINKGIELATGKYFKLMDGDDYFDTESLDKLIEILENETSDIILNNYVEDFSVECYKNPVRHYEFMQPGKQYLIEDLCYDWYGFGAWGPLLSTSTFRTKMLQTANFKISEHCFYVDMELNSFAFVNCKTITYYPLDIYVYYLGRVGQSISAASFKKNYKNHEHVTLRIIEDIYYKIEMSEKKKQYLKNKVIIPLINAQYYITTEHFSKKGPFKSFENRLKKYPEFYNDSNVLEKKLRKYRWLNGNLFEVIKLIIKIKSIFRRG
ncbi:MAG: glycosyltransferase [Bacilli bacterium]|nr:glycosyltransferase [Bacilli bacterium]